MKTINLSEQTYSRLQEIAQELPMTPDQLAERILKEQLARSESKIVIVQRPGGPSAMIKGTRIAVSDIVAYTRIGETAASLAEKILPHLTVGQIYMALGYYDSHKDEIDRELDENSDERSRAYLREHLGDEGYRAITGQQ